MLDVTFGEVHRYTHVVHQGCRSFVRTKTSEEWQVRRVKS